jgi:hypothetical protein
VRDCVLRVAAARNQCADEIAYCEPNHVAPDGHDLACDFESGDVRSTRWRIIQAPALHDIGTVHAGGMNADQYFVGCRRGNWPLHRRKNIGPLVA